MEMKSSSEGHVTLVSQRSNNQTGSITLVFVSITEASVSLLDEGVLGLLIVMLFSVSFVHVFPIVS
jgi:hypothetical protein